MEYVIGTVVGLIYGGLVGFLKYVLLWRPMLKTQNNTVAMKMVTVRLIISYVTNTVTLLVVYFIRNMIPFDFVALAVGTAIALSLSGKIFSMQKVLEKAEI